MVADLKWRPLVACELVNTSLFPLTYPGCLTHTYSCTNEYINTDVCAYERTLLSLAATQSSRIDESKYCKVLRQDICILVNVRQWRAVPVEAEEYVFIPTLCLSLLSLSPVMA